MHAYVNKYIDTKTDERKFIISIGSNNYASEKSHNMREPGNPEVDFTLSLKARESGAQVSYSRKKRMLQVHKRM